MTSPQTIIQIREATDLIRTVSRYVKLRRVGTKQVGLCPFHQERTPSFSVDADKQLWYCFGCGTGGDVFKFLERIEGWKFGDALKYLSEQTRIPLTADTPQQPRSSRQIAASEELGEDAAWFWNQQALRLKRLVTRIYRFDREACRYCQTTDEPKESVWAVFQLAYYGIPSLEEAIEGIEKTRLDKKLAIYQELPARTKTRIRKARTFLDRLTAKGIAVSRGHAPDSRDPGLWGWLPWILTRFKDKDHDLSTDKGQEKAFDSLRPCLAAVHPIERAVIAKLWGVNE